LKSVFIPNSVTEIGNRAFYNMENSLTKVTIGQDVLLNSPWSYEYCFSRTFDEFYNNNNKLAGTYVKINNQWVKQ